MTGMELFIRFAYPGCKRGFCGLSTSENLKLLEDFVYLKKGNERKIREILKTFTAAYGYCELIAQASRIPDPLDFKAVEAYFIGNELLDNVKPEDFKELLKAFRKIRPDLPEIPDEYLAKLKPSHSFHVLVIGAVGPIEFPRTPEEKDECRVSWGQVEMVGTKNNMLMAYQPLILAKRKFLLGEGCFKKIEEGFCQRVKKGTWIFSHLNFAAVIANNKQIENAEKYLQLTLEGINKWMASH
jgi:hypothetical protein